MYDIHKNEIKDLTGITSKEEFINSPAAQERVMDYLENQYEKNIPELRSYVQNTSDDVLKALQHFIGPSLAKVYVSTAKATKSYEKAQEAVDKALKSKFPKYNPNNNLTVQSYLAKFQ